MYNERSRGNNGRREFTVDRLFPTLTFLNQTIITGDMNAYHEWWNSSIRAPKRAETLVSVMEREGFQLVNVPDEPTYNFKNGKEQSVINLIFALPNIFDSILN